MTKTHRNDQIHVVHDQPYRVRRDHYFNMVKEKFPNNDYSNTVFRSVRKTIKFVCPVHGNVIQRADNHRKVGCKVCYLKARHQERQEKSKEKICTI